MCEETPPRRPDGHHRVLTASRERAAHLPGAGSPASGLHGVRLVDVLRRQLEEAVVVVVTVDRVAETRHVIFGSASA